MPEVAFLFPGQGSQYVGMGKSLYENYEVAKRTFESANEILGFDLKKLSFEGPEEELKKTKNSQVAILTVSLASFRCLEEKNIRPEVVAGHSLGEYTALVAAGALSFGEALQLVRKRGEFMEDAGRKHPGTMAAIIGLKSGQVKECLKEAGESGAVELANFNSPLQIVISGEKKAVEKAAEIASQKGAKRTVFLKVSGPFHSSLMESASERLAQELNNFNISEPQIPLIANYRAHYVKDSEMIKEALVKQISHSVQWEPSIRQMLKEGVTTFVEVGPGRVLSGLVKRIGENIKIYNVEDAGSLEEIKEENKCS
jgi:[acyl-carrier-protein] S-malonyltransferase